LAWRRSSVQDTVVDALAQAVRVMNKPACQMVVCVLGIMGQAKNGGHWYWLFLLSRQSIGVLGSDVVQ